MSLDFKKLSELNGKRNKELCVGLFGCGDWVISDWTNALAGEAGEAANFAKKIRRHGPNDRDPEELKAELGKELADVVLYADLTAQFLGLNLEELVTKKFNEVSDKYGSDVKL